MTSTIQITYSWCYYECYCSILYYYHAMPQGIGWIHTHFSHRIHNVMSLWILHIGQMPLSKIQAIKMLWFYEYEESVLPTNNQKISRKNRSQKIPYFLIFLWFLVGNTDFIKHWTYSNFVMKPWFQSNWKISMFLIVAFRLKVISMKIFSLVWLLGCQYVWAL